VLAKSKLGARGLRRHRRAREGVPPEPDQAPGSADPRASVSAVRRRREAGAPQDRAVYSCQCGFVFKALVSTTVGCPHCGDAQAW
jgi:hypothetical protein